MECYRHAVSSNWHSNWLHAFSRAVCSNSSKIRATAFFECVLFLTNWRITNYLHKGPWQYKPTDAAEQSDTITLEGSSSRPGRIKLLSVRWLLVYGSMPNGVSFFAFILAMSDTPYLILSLSFLRLFSLVLILRNNCSCVSTTEHYCLFALDYSFCIFVFYVFTVGLLKGMTENGLRPKMSF